MGLTADTILLVSRNFVHCVVNAGTHNTSVAESLARHPDESLAESVGMMIRSSQRRLGRVWIACTDAWVGEIELERRVAHAVGDEGLAETLALEAENLSGIPAFNSRIASVPQTIGAMAVKSMLPASPRSIESTGENFSAPNVASTANHIVMQIDADEMLAIEAEIKEKRGKLMGIGSAAILQPPIATGDGLSVVVSELESGTILSRNLGASTLTVMTADRFDLARWKSNFGDSLGGPLPSDSMIAIMADLPESPSSQARSGCHMVCWDDPELILRWSRWWLDAVQADDRRCLLVKPLLKPISNTVWTTMSLGAALLVAAGCVAWQYRAAREVDRLGANIEQLRQNSAMPAQLQRSIDSKQKDLDKLQSELLEEENTLRVARQKSMLVANGITFRRQRWEKLFESIAESISPDCFIESIRWNADAVAIEGHSETAAAAHRVANDLGGKIERAGWRVEPAQTEFNDNGLYHFRVLARLASADPNLNPATTISARDLRNDGYGVGHAKHQAEAETRS